MSKFVFKERPEEEVKLGDTITMVFKTQFGTLESTRTVDQKYLKELVEYGIVKEVSESSEKEMNIFHLIAHLAKRLGWKAENLKKYLENLYTINPVAVYQTLLKECAIMIDSNYNTHITASKRLWAVSIVTGEVFELDLSSAGNYTNVALFRTPTEAKLAKRVLTQIEADIF